MDGVSPDDLLPNVGLKKAAELFVKGVMEKIDEIEKQQVEEEETKEVDTGGTEDNILDGDGVEKGVIVSKKMATSCCPKTSSRDRKTSSALVGKATGTTRAMSCTEN